MNKAAIKILVTGLTVGVAAPLIVEYIKKRIKKAEAAKAPRVEVNTDHGFSQWVGDDNFFELEGDTSVNTNPHMSLVPLTSKRRMRQYPTFKKYSPFSVTPAKKIKIV